MASSLVRAAVADVLAGWDSAAVPISMPNEAFIPPAGPWVRVEFPGSAVDRADIGDPVAPMWDEAGALMIHIMVPPGVGDAVATALADAVWELFRGRDVDGVRFDARLDGTAGERTWPGSESAWWGISYGITFRLLSVSA
jgi:hypothetical protein